MPAYALALGPFCHHFPGMELPMVKSKAKKKCIWRGAQHQSCGQDAVEGSNYCKGHSPRELVTSSRAWTEQFVCGHLPETSRLGTEALQTNTRKERAATRLNRGAALEPPREPANGKEKKNKEVHLARVSKRALRPRRGDKQQLL